MKNIFKYIAVGAVLFGMVSCDDDEQNITDQVQETVERGAVLRGVSLISNSLPIGVADAEFSVLLEEQDAEGGALLESMDVFLTFTDGSDAVGDSSGGIVGTEVAVRSVPASEFTPGPFGLPRYTLTIPLTEMLSLVNLTDENIFGGDRFTTRLVLNLTDGRVFSSDNAGGIITGGFFASPFQYSTPVVCPVNEGSFVGEYLITQNTPSIYGVDTFDPDGGGVLTTLAEPNEDGESGTVTAQNVTLEPTQRAFDGIYLASFNIGNGPRTFIMDFICGEVSLLPGQASGLQCSSGITLGPPLGAKATYDFQDDSAFDLIFNDDESGDCSNGGPLDVSITFSKQ